MIVSSLFLADAWLASAVPAMAIASIEKSAITSTPAPVIRLSGQREAACSAAAANLRVESADERVVAVKPRRR